MSEFSRERPIYTVGHSSHSVEVFMSLLARHRIDAVADVRSVPYSRWQPHFNRGNLRRALREQGIAYVFLGNELGARTDDPRCYENGRVRYRLLAKTSLFRSGIARLLQGSTRRTIALMCMEKNPLECHRAILVARELEESGIDVVHILPDGKAETHTATMEKLAADLRLPERDLFITPREMKIRAYAMQERRIARTSRERTPREREALR